MSTNGYTFNPSTHLQKRQDLPIFCLYRLRHYRPQIFSPTSDSGPGASWNERALVVSQQREIQATGERGLQQQIEEEESPS